MAWDATALELTPDRVTEIARTAAAELIDVRRDYEWDDGRIAGARHIEINELTARADSIPRDRPVVFYCRTGNRSSLAASAFREAGWDAYSIAGGLEAWVSLGLPLEPRDGTVAEPRPV